MTAPGAREDGILRVSGSHREVGAALGLACRDLIRRFVAVRQRSLPAGRSLADQHRLAAAYRTVTGEHFPWILDELDGIAEAAQVEPLALFAASTEELWAETRPADTISVPGCTDLASVSTNSGDAQVLVAHTNDLPAGLAPDVRAIEWRVNGHAPVFSLGIGPWMSVAWNRHGLGITGNELWPNDETVGIPRLLLMRAAAHAANLEEACRVVLHPSRASSYNWVLADARSVVSIEGSATAFALLEPDGCGLLHHENHYAHPSMGRFELGHPGLVESRRRARRVRALLAGRRADDFDVLQLRELLSEHGEGAVCRHASSDDDLRTLFWCVACMHPLRITYGIGNPCDSAAAEFAFRRDDQ